MAPPIPNLSDEFGPSQDDLPGLVGGNTALFGVPTVLLDGGLVSLLHLSVPATPFRPPRSSRLRSLDLASGVLLGV